MSETTSRKWRYALTAASVVAALSGVAPAHAATQQATFLVQFNDVRDTDENVYYTVYLLSPSGEYVKTLWVGAPKKPFWKDFPRWYKYISRAPQDNMAAITGASVASGDRVVLHLPIDDKYLNSGYKVRIDTNAEDGSYYSPSVEVALDKKDAIVKNPGTGYVRYFRFKW